MVLLFVFFKQKTAYEMRISDWSSDVCSSDLGSADAKDTPSSTTVSWLDGSELLLASLRILCCRNRGVLPGRPRASHNLALLALGGQIGRASGRERVCQYV